MAENRGAKPGNQHGFTPGNKLAANTGNVKKKRIRKSALRKTLNKLLELEDKSLENIKKSVEGEDIKSDIVNSSKWVITNLMALTKAASADEEAINSARLMLDAAEQQEEQEAEEEATPSSRFSLHVLPTKSDL